MSLDQRYRLVIGLVVILVILNIGSLGFLWYGHLNNRQPRPDREGRSSPEEFLIQQLQLNTDQTQLYRAMRAQHMQETDSLRREIQHLKVQLMEELFVSAPDANRARAISDSIARRQADFELSVYRHFADLKQICDPEQVSRLQPLIFEALNKADQGQPRPRDQRGGEDKPPRERGPGSPTGGL